MHAAARRELFEAAVYLTLDAEGYIVAVAHHRRKPGYWGRRLKDV